MTFLNLRINVKLSISAIFGFNVYILIKKTRYLHTPTKKSVSIYSDASSVKSGAYTVEVDSKVFHLMWKESEKSMRAPSN